MKTLHDLIKFMNDPKADLAKKFDYLPLYVKNMRLIYEDAPKCICAKLDKEGKEIPNNDTMAEIAKIQKIPDVFYKVIYPLWDFLTGIKKWEKQELLDRLKEFSKNVDIKFRDLAWIMRIILQGQSIGPDLFDFMAIVGKDRCLHYLTFFMDEFAE